MTSEEVPTQLRLLAHSDDFPLILRRSAQLADLAVMSKNPGILAAELADLATNGPIAALVAIESLVRVSHTLADDALVELLSNPVQIVRRHAAWRLAERPAAARAYSDLIGMLTLGGIDTMHAHRTLRRWADTDASSIVRFASARLSRTSGAAERARLVDLLGVVDTDTDEVLLRVALDVSEASPVRVAAIGALGGRPGLVITAALKQLVTSDCLVGSDAALALTSHVAKVMSTPGVVTSSGLRVAQLVLAEGLDGQLSLGGKGDTGGVASLLVSLGEALAARPEVNHVLTIGRGDRSDAVTGPHSSNRVPLSYDMVAFGDQARPGRTPSEVWEHLPAIERGLKRVLHRGGPIDVLHLRMADAGTLAGAEVAASLGIPICFSVAPDPHNVLESLQLRGELNEDSFVHLLTDTHIWFKARMIERLTNDAEHLALFPRSRPIAAIDEIISTRPQERIAVVAEGIDLRLLDRAAEPMPKSLGAVRAPDVLVDLATSIPKSRRHLPLALSIGRLNPVKGMGRVVTAWASDPQLHETCNLVIVGGDLEEPSAMESAVLAEIEQAVPTADPRRAGLVLLGGRPRFEVARLQIAVTSGRPGAWSGGGIYVDGALKEEFGLAVLEALTVGLVVVAPSTGGPSTYVDHGDTGVLVEPNDDLAPAMIDAFGLVGRLGRSVRARTMVEERYSIDTMASQLVNLYRPAMASK